MGSQLTQGTEVGLGPGDIVLDEDPAPVKNGHSSPEFSTYVCCSQTAGWIKMSFGTEVGIGQGHTVLYGDPAPPPPTRSTAHVTKWHLDPSSRLATIDIGRKFVGGCCAPSLFEGGAGYPSNTTWPEPRPTSVPSGILIHPAVSPQ